MKINLHWGSPDSLAGGKGASSSISSQEPQCHPRPFRLRPHWSCMFPPHVTTSFCYKVAPLHWNFWSSFLQAGRHSCCSNQHHQGAEGHYLQCEVYLGNNASVATGPRLGSTAVPPCWVARADWPMVRHECHFSS